MQVQLHFDRARTGCSSISGGSNNQMRTEVKHICFFDSVALKPKAFAPACNFWLLITCCAVNEDMCGLICCHTVNTRFSSIMAKVSCY